MTGRNVERAIVGTILVLIGFMAFAGENLVPNGQFKDGISGWTFNKIISYANYDKEVRDSSMISWDGPKGCLRLKLDPDKMGKGCSVNTGVFTPLNERPVKAGKTVKVSFSAKSVSGKAYMIATRQNGNQKTIDGKQTHDYKVFEIQEGIWTKCETEFVLNYDMWVLVISMVASPESTTTIAKTGEVLIDNVSFEVVK